MIGQIEAVGNTEQEARAELQSKQSEFRSYYPDIMFDEPRTYGDFGIGFKIVQTFTVE